MGDQVEKPLANEIPAEQKRCDERERHLDEAIAALSEFDAKYGSFADQYLDDI